MRNFDFEFEEKEFLKHLYQKYGLESIVIYCKSSAKSVLI